MFLSISVPLQLINLESFCFKTFYSVIKSVHKLEVRTYISFGSSFDKNHYDTNRTWQYRIWLSTVKLWFLHGRAELDFEDFLVCIDSVPFWKISSLSIFGWQVSFLFTQHEIEAWFSGMLLVKYYEESRSFSSLYSLTTWNLYFFHFLYFYVRCCKQILTLAIITCRCLFIWKNNEALVTEAAKSSKV